ncbi:MAG: hypothetical protein K6U89_16140 [Chloroflexi bacterium]|nr:hypothetical protein [Chloroflexota bacterium]
MDFAEQIFPRRELFRRALLRLVALADQHGVSLTIDGFSVLFPVRGGAVSYELQQFGRTIVRRLHRGQPLATAESFDFEEGLALFERFLEEVER